MLAWGCTAIVERLPSGAVMKTPIPNPYCPIDEKDHLRHMRLEAKVYATIGIISWSTFEATTRTYPQTSGSNGAYRLRKDCRCSIPTTFCIVISHQGTFSSTRTSI